MSAIRSTVVCNVMFFSHFRNFAMHKKNIVIYWTFCLTCVTFSPFELNFCCFLFCWEKWNNQFNCSYTYDRYLLHLPNSCSIFFSSIVAPDQYNNWPVSLGRLQRASRCPWQWLETKMKPCITMALGEIMSQADPQTHTQADSVTTTSRSTAFKVMDSSRVCIE